MEKLGLRLRNEYTIRLIDSKTGRVKEEVKTHNVVLNSWYDQLNTWDSLINRLYLGTGSGVPSVTDTGLFSSLGYVGVESSQRVYPDEDYCVGWSWDFRFTENQCNGLLTELGLAYGNTVVTHSRFTDSEDQPMTIEKTDTDILLVSASVYATITWSGIFKPILYWTGDANVYTQPRPLVDSFSRRMPQSANSVLSPFCLKILLVGYGGDLFNNLNCGYFSLMQGLGPVKMSSQSQMSRAASQFYCMSSSGSDTALSTGYRRTASSRILADSKNAAGTMLIKGLGIGSSSNLVFYTELPNHEIFPPKLLTFTKIGDGVSTDFNLGIPELMTSGVEISIDGVPLSSSDYDFLGKDYNLSQAWPSQEARFLDKSSCSWHFSYISGNAAPCYVPLIPLVNDIDGQQMYTNGGIALITTVYDFEEPIPISCFRCKIRGNYGDPGGTHCLYSSDDGETWTLRASATFSNHSFNITFPSVTARYWKFEKSDNSTYSAFDYLNYSACGDANSYIYMAFGDPKPQLRFHTPPANGSEIVIKAYCEYPVKNSNWLFDPLVVDWKIERAV